MPAAVQTIWHLLFNLTEERSNGEAALSPRAQNTGVRQRNGFQFSELGLLLKHLQHLCLKGYHQSLHSFSHADLFFTQSERDFLRIPDRDRRNNFAWMALSGGPPPTWRKFFRRAVKPPVQCGRNNYWVHFHSCLMRVRTFVSLLTTKATVSSCPGALKLKTVPSIWLKSPANSILTPLSVSTGKTAKAQKNN